MSTTETQLPQKNGKANWPDLPADLLRTISRKLPDIFDFIYFRSVCKSWYTSTSISNDLPPLIPWLLSREGRPGRLRFYSIFSGKMRTIYCPQSRYKVLCGPSYGYLYAIRYTPGGCRKHSLLNPLTKDEVTLRLRKRFHDYCMVSMSQNLIADDDYMAFLDPISMRMEFYQPHKPKRYYAGGCSYPLWKTPRGGACLKGMYFAHQKTTCETDVFDIARGYSFVIPPPKMHGHEDKVCFIESAGRILRIVMHRRRSDLESAPFNHYVFDIYQLEDVEVQNEIHQYRWVKIDGIGNHALFLDSLFIVSGISITASESAGLRGNCIYYTERFGYDCRIYRYDVEEGRSQRIPCPRRKFWTWFVPSLVSMLPSS